MEQIIVEIEKFIYPVKGYPAFDVLKQLITPRISQYQQKANYLLEQVRKFLVKVKQYCNQKTYPNPYIKKMIYDIFIQLLNKKYKETQNLIERNFKCQETIYLLYNEAQKHLTQMKQLFVDDLSKENQEMSAFYLITKNTNFKQWTVLDVIQISQNPKQSETNDSVKITKNDYTDDELITENDYTTDETMTHYITFYTYMNNLRMVMINLIPQIIQTELVNELCDKLFLDTINYISRDEIKKTMEEYLKEDPKLTKERKKVTNSLINLKQAQKKLKDLQEQSIDYYSSSSLSYQSESLDSDIESE
ncbi:hypothetical protein ABPG72_017089 [Tetrahymena utriculariae]